MSDQSTLAETFMSHYERVLYVQEGLKGLCAFLWAFMAEHGAGPHDPLMSVHGLLACVCTELSQTLDTVDDFSYRLAALEKDTDS